jgi:hypothetical protein
MIVRIYGRRAKAWELFLVLFWVNIVYLMVALSVLYFPEDLILLPTAVLFLSLFVINNDELGKVFVWWIRLLEIIYLIGIMMGILFYGMVYMFT